MNGLRVLKGAAPVALAASLGGCALPPPSGCMSEPAPEQALVSLPTEAMGPAARRVRFADPREFDEYVLYRGGNGERLEAVYMETRFKHGSNVVLNFAEPLERRVLGFAYNAGTRPAFGEAHRVDTAFGGLWTKPYRHAVNGQHCLGFIDAWDNRPDDPEYRPSKALYGYYCAPAGAAADAAVPDDVLRTLEAGLRPVEAGAAGPSCDDAGIRSTMAEGQDILARAQPSGAAGSPAAAGDAEFPPVRAVRFHDSRDDTDFEI